MGKWTSERGGSRWERKEDVACMYTCMCRMSYKHIYVIWTSERGGSRWKREEDMSRIYTYMCRVYAYIYHLDLREGWFEMETRGRYVMNIYIYVKGLGVMD